MSQKEKMDFKKKRYFTIRRLDKETTDLTLAKRLGVSPATIARWNKGVKNEL